MKKYITVEELSDLLQLSPRTIYQYTSNQTLPYVKIGSSVRFDVDDIKAWIEGKKVTPTKN